MDEESIHIVAHYNSKTGQVYINVFEDPDNADEWSAERQKEDEIEALLYKVVDLPEDYADDTVEQWEEHL
jgi:hypothetical protein